MDNNLQNNVMNQNAGIQPNTDADANLNIQPIPDMPVQNQPQVNQTNMQNTMAQTTMNSTMSTPDVQQPQNIDVPNQNTTIQPNINNVDPIQNTQNTIPPQQHVDMEAHIKDQLQNIPTVEQDKQAFINNVQNMNQETNEQKKESINFVFIIILFLIILAAIYFLFPILLKYI